MRDIESQDQYRRVWAAYPSIAEWVNKNAHNPTETFRAWRDMISGCELSDVVAVVSRIVSGDLQPYGEYEKPDALPRTIKSECKLLSDARWERQNSAKYQSSSRGAWKAITADRTGRYAVLLGSMVRDHEITKEENDRRFAELMAWDKGGDRPAWMDELDARPDLANPLGERESWTPNPEEARGKIEAFLKVVQENERKSDDSTAV